MFDNTMNVMTRTTTPRSDEQWLSGLASSPPHDAAVTELRALLRRGLARSLAGRGDVNDADLDDFAQDSVLRILDRIGSFRGDSRFTTWAIAIAIRVAYSAMRRRRWGERSLEDLGVHVLETARGAAGGDAPAATVARQDVLAALHRAIEEALTPRQRAAILAELAGMPTEVLAEQLGTNANALYKLHHDARKKLRGALEAAGYSEADVRYAASGASP